MWVAELNCMELDANEVLYQLEIVDLMNCRLLLSFLGYAEKLNVAKESQFIWACDKQVCILQEPRKFGFHAFVPLQ